MIDLNKKFITEEIIFDQIEPYDIYRYYAPNIKMNNTISSPFRKDENPSFSIYNSKKYNTLLFKDFATGDIGNAVTFVQRLFAGYNKFDALSQIAIDFGIADKYICTSLNKSQKQVPKKSIFSKFKKKEPTDLRIKFRIWQKHDLTYWKQFGISLLTLRKFKVLPISHYFLYDKKYNAEKYAYAFIENKDNRMSFKIYQPYADKSNKWRTNHSYSAHQGYLQLPKKDELLIITKSLKDVMAIYENTGIPSIGIQCETYVIKESVLNEYKTRFNNRIVVFFDNDAAGIQATKIYKTLFSVEAINTPMGFYNVKDFSDFVKSEGTVRANNFMYHNIAQVFPKWTPF